MTTVALSGLPVQRGPQTRPPKVPRPTPAPRVIDPFMVRLTAEVGSLASAEARQLVDDFWRHHRRVGTPRIGPVDHDGHHLVTFLWRDRMVGQRAVDGVVLFINRLTDERALDRSVMALIPGTDIWHLSVRMAADWRASYAFIPLTAENSLLTETDQVEIRRLLDLGRPDPFNSDRVWSSQGGQRSVVSLVGAPAQPWLAVRPAVPAGILTEVQSPELPGYPARPVWIHRPSGVEKDAPLPVLLLLDGEVWSKHVSILPTLANLMVSGRIPPMITVLPHAGGRQQRWTELCANEKVIDTLADQLLPWTLGRVPDQVTIAGVSLGGLTAVAAGLLRPDRFTGVAALSGSLWWNAEPDPTAPPTLQQWATRAPTHTRFDLQVGSQEWVLTGPHHDLTAALVTHGHRARLTEYNGGHDFACWRGGLAEALIRLHEEDSP